MALSAFGSSPYTYARSLTRSLMPAAKVLHVTHRHKCVVASEVIRFANGDVVEAAIVLLEFVVDTRGSDAVSCILNEIRYTTWATFTHSVKQTCGNSLRNLGFFPGVLKKFHFTVRLRLRWWLLLFQARKIQVVCRRRVASFEKLNNCFNSLLTYSCDYFIQWHAINTT